MLSVHPFTYASPSCSHRRLDTHFRARPISAGGSLLGVYPRSSGSPLSLPSPREVVLLLHIWRGLAAYQSPILTAVASGSTSVSVLVGSLLNLLGGNFRISIQLIIDRN